MVYCKKCGKEIPDHASYCPGCGASQLMDNDPYRPSNNQYNRLPVYDSGSFGWFILGFFFTLVGFILWLVWMNEKPKTAKMCGLGALVSVIVSVLIVPIVVIAVLAAAGTTTTTTMLFL